ncbi:hypothetical protein KR032_003885 [Drosophila birchii]|nr:hypothetical protein KR032_003885 [Drosophila birchii]
MAQKKAVAAKGKNGVEKPAKRGAKAVKPQEEEEELVAQSPPKKGKKLPVKEVPQSSEEDSDDEEQNGGEEEDSDSQAEDVGDLIDDEAEEDDEDDSDDDDDDELEPGEASIDNIQAGEDDDEDSDDEAPAEEPVGKKAKVEKQANGEKSDAKKGGIPKIRVGKIPPGTPKNQIVFASNLPKEYTHKDLVALFTKFGPISIVSRLTDKTGQNKVIIAFETAAGAEAALAAKEKALTLGGNVVAVSLLRDRDETKERTVVVSLIGPRVTTDEIKAHFEQIGPVDAVTLSTNKGNPKAFVRYLTVSDAQNALKLHSTEFFSRFITVRPQVCKEYSEKTPETTLILENVDKHESYNSDAIEKIFKKFDVHFTDVACSKQVLAFVTFKKAEGATNALAQLNGKTVNNLELKLSRFQRTSSGQATLVTNLTNETTEDQLRELFSQSGEIESVTMLKNKAVIKFTSDEAFCKSFLLNEHILNNQPLFVEPNSLLKHRLFAKKHKFGFGGPGAPPAGKFTGKPQKFGNNKGNFGNKPFNKRPYQENGAKPFVKRPRF